MLGGRGHISRVTEVEWVIPPRACDVSDVSEDISVRFGTHLDNPINCHPRRDKLAQSDHQGDGDRARDP